MQKCLYKDKLAFFAQAATPEFWDTQWQGFSQDPARGLELGVPAHVLNAVRRWVPAGGRCLEAGCGMGNIVYGLSRAGWPCVGLDYAEKTVRALQGLGRGLEVCLGDVRAIPFPDRSFDCYISQGVIEHFPEGYDGILREMDRVLRPGGVALVSFPSVNLVRRLKRALACYPPAGNGTAGGREFYQFALDPEAVSRDLHGLGYTVLERVRYEGLLGIADEAFRPLNWYLHRFYNYRSSRLCSGVRRVLEPLVAPWAGYCCQVTARKPR